MFTKEKHTKNKIMIAAVFLILVAIICVSMTKINSKADEVSQKQEFSDDTVVTEDNILDISDSSDTDIMNNTNYIEYLRKLNKDVTIFSIEELYSTLNNKQNISKDNIEEILASSSDDVIKEFVTKEIFNSTEVFEQLNNSNNIILENEDIDYIKDVKIQESQTMSGNSYKIVSTVENKYGTTMTFKATDMDESALITKENWLPLIPHTSTATVKYGTRSFVYDGIIKIGNVKVFGVKSTFKYIVSNTGLKSDVITTKIENVFPSMIGLKVLEKKYTDTSASKVGENIDGYVKTEMQGQWFGKIYVGRVRQKYNASIRIINWDKKKKTMKVQYSVKPYQDVAL